MKIFKRLALTQRDILAVVGIGLFLILLVFHYWYANHHDINLIKCDYQLIDPVRCNFVESGPVKEYSNFKNELADWLADQKEQGTIVEASVYFRDLTHGPIFFINPDSPYAPASLVKVPMMMSYFKAAETDPDLLNKTVRTAAKFGDPEQILVKPRLTLQPNTNYSIAEMINRMIISSDNHSLETLLNYYQQLDSDANPVLNTMLQLGMLPADANEDNYLTVKQYSSLFRVLYDAVYLNPAMSNRALDLLTQTDYKNGLEAPLPPGTKVAHKFGIFNDSNSIIQLHEAGIIYSPKGNYILTVMTKAPTLKQGETVIQEISRRVWDEYSARQ